MSGLNHAQAFATPLHMQSAVAIGQAANYELGLQPATPAHRIGDHPDTTVVRSPGAPLQRL
jgi:hypothetical protein